MEYGYEIRIWNIKRLYRAGSLITIEIWVRFSESAGDQMEGRWHRTCGRIHVFLWKGE
jgi:hypothetical protein